MTAMRAKLQVASIQPYGEPVTQERVIFHGVAATSYPADGSDEDNTFAKFSPSVALDIVIANPALLGGFEVGQKYYADFSPAE